MTQPTQTPQGVVFILVKKKKKISSFIWWDDSHYSYNETLIRGEMNRQKHARFQRGAWQQEHSVSLFVFKFWISRIAGILMGIQAPCYSSDGTSITRSDFTCLSSLAADELFQLGRLRRADADLNHIGEESVWTVALLWGRGNNRGNSWGQGHGNKRQPRVWLTDESRCNNPQSFLLRLNSNEYINDGWH